MVRPSSPDLPPSPTSPKLERAATFGGPSFSNRSDRPAPSGRMPPPPRIDPNAASKKQRTAGIHENANCPIDRPYRPLEPTSTTDQNKSRSRSPVARPPPKSPFLMNRSVTTPIPRAQALPSPDLPPNMDCAFPAFPRKGSTPQNAKPRTQDRLDAAYHQRYAAPSPLFAPLSPRTNGGENITKRLDAIAPGPFDGRAGSRPSTANASKPSSREGSIFGHRRTATQDSTMSRDSGPQQRTSVASHGSHVSHASRSSAYSNRSVGLPSSPRAHLRGGSGSAPPPSKPSEGIDAFLDRLQRETTAPSHARSGSGSSIRYGMQEKREPPPRPRRPSERDLPPNDMTNIHNQDYMPFSNNSFQSRAPSRNGSASEEARHFTPPQSLRPPPPLLATALGLDTPGSSLHTPSDSGLSDDSYASSGFRSAASSRSSPPGSIAGHSREASKLSHSEYAEETYERTASPESYTNSGSANYVASSGSHSIPRALSPGYSSMPESPMDPAIALGTAFERYPRSQGTGREPFADNTRRPSHANDVHLHLMDNRRPKPASKGNCRGCSEPIVGKSVKDSSGRLTGRYHKQCFVCRTCADPFPTAEFYVFENSPYCEQHYHRLNGSLCGSCHSGIEGQYLETDSRQKFHPGCFTCSTCRIVLRDGYFDVNGQRYCDRHAQSAAAPPREYLGPGNYKPRNLQKRGTRLMMMA